MIPVIYIKNRRYYQNRIKHILKYISVENTSVLDLACGEMLLYKLKGFQMKSYFGIDQINFQEHPCFLQANILDDLFRIDIKVDVIFLLGVLDHLNFDQKLKLIEKFKQQFTKTFIISQFNELAWIYKKRNSMNAALNLNAYFNNLPIQYIYLIKLPFLKFVWDVTHAPNWIKKNCTEKVALISMES